ncbi:MFS transporter [Rhizorhabdus argentea]|uniref:MFS transporter n=1 Tax=Rhizorhabdus argentea TaxID=1387174 RepID=UPI0030EEA490
MAEENSGAIQRQGTFGPLRERLFRRIWTASLFSNFGALIQSVGAAWAMTQLTGRADMVALVQSATFAPLMLISLPSGAIADSYDRRKIALVALGIAFVGAIGLSLVTVLGLLTPGFLLLFCFMVGTGTALLSPAWQASVSEQVPPQALPQAITLNSISYNIARSFGPAIGGLLVAAAGVLAAFVFNALAYLPMIVVMFLWRRPAEASRLPPEALGRAIISGVRFAIHSPPIRTVFLRSLLLSTLGASISALMPLVARELLGGGASLYGILLGCFGVGAVLGALVMARIKAHLSEEQTTAACLVLLGLCMVGVGLSRDRLATGLLLLGAGAGWMILVAISNISIQVSSPRWVTARALAAFTTAVCAGLSIGSWGWGHVAASHGTGIAMILSGSAMILSAAAGLVLRMPEIEEQRDPGLVPSDPDVRLEVSGRSGPVILTIEYRVLAEQARAFYTAMLSVEPIRYRTGGYAWSLARDVADPELWTERYHTPTWHDYLRQRSRLTAADVAIWNRALAFHQGGKVTIRRMLERPYGSVRWSEDVPDRGILLPLPPQGS